LVKRTTSLLLWTFLSFLSLPALQGQPHSVARQWNEAILHSIRNDFARPTVHARNLFHSSILMYDAWAIFDEQAETYFLGKTLGSYSCPFSGFVQPEDVEAAREEILSYALYRLLRHRFRNSPGIHSIYRYADSLMLEMGYDTGRVSTDYSDGDPAHLGNYMARQMILFGLQDGSNEQNDYANRYYEPVNRALVPIFSGNPNISFPDRWQPLSFTTFVDQSGNAIPNATPPFLSPEWGEVVPFALSETDLSLKERGDYTFHLYHDPGPPPLLWDEEENMAAEYQWGFSLVGIWSAHLDPSDSVMWDISPGNLGNNPEFPTGWEGLRQFYRDFEGGDLSRGHAINPHTQQPYEPQWVPRGDYTRVLAEFWADGPDSETPPGHWFAILNYVNDHPLQENRFQGEGALMDELEWDVKAYFALGGAMHDAAISAWGVKGWYDYVRPISAIRYMASQGQSSDPNLPNYSPYGLPLVPGFIELVTEGDPLAFTTRNLNRIKLYGWRGPDYIDDPENTTAGVGWILAERWWPYQRPDFVTPNFAGYVSGHSTFSRAAAEVLTLLTGDPFFPGGMGEFVAKKNEFLVFEDGPSQDVILQWATYRDASDQTSLSRIWGGIHPPADDIPGRQIGILVGQDAFELATTYFEGEVTSIAERPESDQRLTLFPNPVARDGELFIQLQEPAHSLILELFTMQGQSVKNLVVPEGTLQLNFPLDELTAGPYILRVRSPQWSRSRVLIVRD
jgi:hypothetical protein